MKVREATHDDMPSLLHMCVAMHDESPRYRGLPYSEEKMFDLISAILNRQKAGGVLVAETDGKLAGMLGFVIAEHFFGPAQFSCDLGAYVRPEHRGGTAFAKLVRAYEKSAKTQGVCDTMLGVSTGIHAEVTAAMLERMGYKRCGITLLKGKQNV